MEKNELIQIDNNEILERFLSFLKPDKNIDILLSAPFGTGKTYFLQNDFKNKTTEEYNIFHLFPVNYSISSNEDIMELIKYDILIECMLNHFDEIESAESLGFSKALQYLFYLSEKFDFLKFSNNVIEKVSLLSDDDSLKSASGILKLSTFLNQQFRKIKKEVQPKTEDIIIEDFLRDINEQKGNIYENNPYTKFIRSFLTKIKGDNKKNILIIDDLDRIDPEHIFRLFNVFSAQKNYNTKIDKFGFDKVIFVCDISNIMKIYEHKYGEGVDFWGYISKFVSDRVFHFNNKDLVGRHLYRFLDNVPYNNNLDYEVILSDNSPASNDCTRLVIFLLKMLIYFDYLSLRDIVKKSSLYISSDIINNKTNFQIINMYLDIILGSEGKFKTILESLQNKSKVYNYKSINEKENRIIEEYKTLFYMIYYQSTKKNLPIGNISNFSLSNSIQINVKNNNSVIEMVIMNGDITKFDLINFLLEHI